MTRNDFYRGLNRRFDRRWNLLRRFGFKYLAGLVDPENERGLNLAVITRRRGWLRGSDSISAGHLMEMSNERFREWLSGVLVRNSGNPYRKGA